MVNLHDLFFITDVLDRLRVWKPLKRDETGKNNKD